MSDWKKAERYRKRLEPDGEVWIRLDPRGEVYLVSHIESERQSLGLLLDKIADKLYDEPFDGKALNKLRTLAKELKKGVN